MTCLLLLGACHRDISHGVLGSAAQPLETSVNSAIATDRLATSTLETKQAAPGNRFVVLDVTARNRDGEPLVFSEGRLVNVSGTHERTFATPVTMLSSEFLTLQVLKPSSSVRGRIAYEVPEDLPGVLYWVPDRGNQRILLHVAGGASAVTTSENAPPGPRARAQPTASQPIVGTQPRAATVRPRPAASPLRPEAKPARGAPSIEAAAASQRVASIAAPVRTAEPVHNEQARTLACQALVSRNDAAEKARYLGFFSRECEGYAMPSAWVETPLADAPMPPADAPRWPPRPGPSFDCSQAYTRAEHLVCEDAVLSLMDWELTRAYSSATRSVPDPGALRRDEDDWRHRVRDACDSVSCLQDAYGRRTSDLEATARAR